MKKARPATTSHDVARLAGVSQSAVSRAFTPNSSLSEDKRARILEAATTLNYVPNSIASSLITNRTNTIGVIVGDTDNPFYVHVLKSFIQKLQDTGLQALIFTVGAGQTADDAIMRVLGYRVDGIVLTSAQLSSRMVHLCQDRDIPVVLFNRYIPGSDAHVVRCDNVGGGKLMADAFLQAGAKSFALLKGDLMGTTSQDRIEGFCSHLYESGVPLEQVHQIDGNAVYDDAYAAMVETFVTGGRALPDAIFGVNDIMAMAAIDVVRHHLGKTLPQDIMIGGFDDIPEAQRAPYNLTTVHQPVNEMVAETIAILKRPQNSDSVHRQLASRLVWRGTVPGHEPTL